MADVKLTALSLDEVADYLEILASDQRASLRWVKLKRERAECEAKALAYGDAAKIVRNVTLIPPETELVAALRGFVLNWRHLNDDHFTGPRDKLLALAEAAIAKATGGQP